MATSTALNGAEVLTYESRDQVPAEYRWDLELFYSDWEEWEADVSRMEALFTELAGYKGRLLEGPETLLKAMKLSDEAGMVTTKAWGYVAQVQDLDTRDNEIRGRYGKIMALYSKLSPMLAWISPEILSIPQETMEGWIDANPELEPYRFGLIDTYRTGKYTLDEQGEKLLSLHGRVRHAPEEIFSALTNADGDRPVVTLSNGEELTITPGVYGKALNIFENADDRRKVQEAWMRQFQDRRNTFASIYGGVLSQGWVLAQSRGYENTLQMELNGNNIPVDVVTSLVEAARSGAPELQRYHRLRQQFLGLEDYGWSDMHVTLVPHDKKYPYDEVVPLVVDSVAPLGEEYQTKMAEQFKAGYVDVYETPGKRSGAYNTGRYGVGSFVLLNYQGTLDDFFTVAHEMGHSMHTRLSQEYQPFATHRYTIFVAEVASTLNEKLLLQKLLQTVDEPRERIAFIERQLDAIKGTFFLQTMMADFEMQAHKLVEEGEGITADRLTELWKEVVSAYHGDVIPEDDPYMYSWARIPHLYGSPFYVYQYATCYASSSALMKQMQEDPEATVERYLELLKSGGNAHPMDQLQKAGVDLTRPEILHAVVEEFGRLVDLLEVEYTRFLDDQKSIG
ncbi:MAG: oligoendopeptidase F [Oceanipulchritudo sp.]